MILDDLKENVCAAWNQVEEALTSFNELTDDELIECRESIKTRLKVALQLIIPYVSDEDGKPFNSKN